MSINQNNRRQFLKFSSLGLFSAYIGSRLIQPSTAHAQAPVMVSESEPLAKSLGYHEDAAKVDTKKWSKRAGPEGAKQFCWNCQFYQVKEKQSASKTGPCTLFANKHVTAKGWCQSWAPNPNAK